MSAPPYPRGFTLIELLVVVAVIGILSSLLFPVLSMIMTSAKFLKSSQRLDEAIRALNGLGGQEISNAAAQLIHQRLAERAGVLGVTEFEIDKRLGIFLPLKGDWIPAPYSAPYLAHPWGRVPTDTPGAAPTAIPTAPLPVEDFTLSQMQAQDSAVLMELAGIIPDGQAASYASDHRAAQPWNDAWGRPLLLAWALYLPRKNTAVLNFTDRGSHGVTASGQSTRGQREDLFLQRAMDAYGFHRAVYLAGGVVGPFLPTTVPTLDVPSASFPVLLTDLWSSVVTVCNGEGWRTDAGAGINAWTTPPWKGSVRGKLNGLTSLLTQPQETH